MTKVTDSPWLCISRQHRVAVWFTALPALIIFSLVFWTAETLKARQGAAVVVIVSAVALGLAIATGAAYSRRVRRSRV